MASNIDQDWLDRQEKSIQFYLEACETYIIGCLRNDCVKVILDYKEFTHDQKRKLMSYEKHELPDKVLHRLFKEIRSLPNHKRRYTALLDAVKGNQKVHSILKGRAIPTGDLSRTVLFQTATEICNALNVEEILPSLLAKDVITELDCQTIIAKHKTDGNWRAAVKLLDCLPNRHPYWFRQLLEALEESKHGHLVQLLTSKYDELKGKDTPFKEDKELYSLQTLQSGTSDKTENEKAKRTDRPLRADREFHSLDVLPSESFKKIAVVRGSRSEPMPTARLEKQLKRMQLQEKTGKGKTYNTIDAIHLKQKQSEFEQKILRTGCGENTVKYSSLPDRTTTTLYEYDELKGKDTPFKEDKELYSLQTLQSGTSDKTENEEAKRTDRPLRADREFHSLDVLPSESFKKIAIARGSRSEPMPTARLEKQLKRMQLQEKTGKGKTYNTIDAIHLKQKQSEFEQKILRTGCGENTVKYSSLPDRTTTILYARNDSSSSKTEEWLNQQNIGESWRQVFRGEIQKPYFQELWKFVEKERRLYGPAVSPRSEKVFCWTKYCRLDEVKVVILAENPTSGHGGANGLAFGVKRGQSIPKYLSNIYKEIQHDIQGFVPPDHGNLKGWAHQGVLLLNSVLTWRREDLGHSQIKNLHQDHGWEVFTDEILSYLNLHAKHPLVFMLWGKKVQQKGSLINEKIHWVLEAPHPSPLSAWRGFYGCKHFSKCNNILVKQGKEPIDWSFLPERMTANR